MALSLNVGSFGLLMDPLNGVADIENRELRLVSNYGFIEDPIRMVRAARLMARLGWGMDEKTQSRYETGKQENYIAAASAFSRGYEAEEVVHEEDPIRVLKRLESEGWLKEIAPFWTAAKANEAELERLRESQAQLQIQGIHPSPAAANFPLLTAKMSAKEIADLKATFPRAGFVHEIEALETEAKDLAAQLTAKTAALPSQAWKLLYSAKPEAILQVAFSSKSAAIQAKFKSFFTEWPQARQKVPYALMQEMRIVPELPGLRRLRRVACLRTHGRQAVQSGRSQGVPRTVLAARSAAAGSSPPPARTEEGRKGREGSCQEAGCRRERRRICKPRRGRRPK